LQIIGSNSQDELYFPITCFEDLDIDEVFKIYL